MLPDLSRQTIPGTKSVVVGGGIVVTEVSTQHAFIQAAGYIKYIFASYGENIYYRGQEDLYKGLTPSLFRPNPVSQSHQSALSEKKNKFISDMVGKCPIFTTFNRVAHEPLLQHYGLKSTWLDIVDNLWVALWFASNTARSLGTAGQYLHFEKRKPNSDSEQSAYVLLIGTDSASTGVPGYFKGTNTECVDLRICVPSIFLRPHAQHGLLFRQRAGSVMRPVDYTPQIRGVLKIKLEDAIRWLGDAQTLSAHGLFPPPFYDQGYKILLESEYSGSRDIGSISLVGA